MKHDNLTEVLPAIRVTPEVKAKLRRKAAQSVSKSLTDHIRYAVELYVADVPSPNLAAQPERNGPVIYRLPQPDYRAELPVSISPHRQEENE